MSETSSRFAKQRHRYAPTRVCMIHLALYSQDLCPEWRAPGSKLCEAHMRTVGRAAGMMSRREWDRLVEERDEANRVDVAGLRRMLEEARDENKRLATEVHRLLALPPSQRTRKAQGEGMVYALQSGYNIKIGWTGRDLPARLREYPPSSSVLVAYPAQRGEETRIKRRFSHLRTHGNEWFPYAPEVTEWVARMVAEHGEPDPTWTCGPAKYVVPRPHQDKGGIRRRRRAA